MKVDEAMEIIEKAIQEACSQYLFEQNAYRNIEAELDEAVKAGQIVKWSKDVNGDYIVVPKRPTEFISLSFVATADGVVFEELKS